MLERTFTVVSRGPSAAIFRPDTQIHLENFPSTLGPVQVRIRTRWFTPKDNVTLPGDLWIEVSGPGPSLSEVIGPFATAGAAALPIISLVTNAAVLEPEIEIGFETTQGSERREYFQSFLAPEVLLPAINRFVRPKPLIALIDAFQGHSELKRLIRSINQYRIALEYWKMGRESHSVGHLWMAAEALTKSIIRKECESRGISAEKDLALAFGVELKELDALVRRQIIFRSDDDCYKKAKKVSDGFEHGFLDYGEMIVLAKSIRKLTAKYVRLAILDLCNLAPDFYTEITKEGTHEPLGYWPVAKYIKGTLIGSGNVLAQPGSEYPFLHWTTVTEAAVIDDEGNLQITPKETIKPEIAQDIQFTDLSIEFWRPE